MPRSSRSAGFARRAARECAGRLARRIWRSEPWMSSGNQTALVSYRNSKDAKATIISIMNKYSAANQQIQKERNGKGNSRKPQQESAPTSSSLGERRREGKRTTSFSVVRVVAGRRAGVVPAVVGVSRVLRLLRLSRAVAPSMRRLPSNWHCISPRFARTSVHCRTARAARQCGRSGMSMRWFGAPGRTRAQASLFGGFPPSTADEAYFYTSCSQRT